jgi:hypothetical protein
MDLEKAAPKITTGISGGTSTQYLVRGYFCLQTMVHLHFFIPHSGGWKECHTTNSTKSLQNVLPSLQLTQSSLFSRNKVKLQAYQWEYAQIKQALGRRKIGKEGHALLEKGQVKKHQVMAMEDLPVSQKSALGQCVFSSSCNFPLTQTSRAYVCALILHSQKVDPQCTPDMIQMEEQARQYFLETRETLQLFSLSCWIEPFQKHVDDFIQEQLAEAAKIMAVPGKEPEDAIRLHGLWHLIAGAIQEEELVQQPDYAFTYTKLDRAIIWDGQG